MSFKRSCLMVVLSVALVSASAAPAQQPTNYMNAQEAYNVGAAFASARNYAAAQAPLEAALRLAQDNVMRIRVSESLVLVYRKLNLLPQAVQSSEMVIEHSDQEAKRSIYRRGLIEMVREQGKGDEFIARHEKILKDQPQTRTSVYLLAEAYDQIKRDPQRAAAMNERLLEIDKAAGVPPNPREAAALAGQYAKAKKFREAAELYEKIADADPKLTAWHLKEAATAWMQIDEKEKALSAARRSANGPSEARNELLTYFWLKGLADVFLKAGDPAAAVRHYEQAIQKTTNEGYRKDCEKLLAEAKEKANVAL